MLEMEGDHATTGGEGQDSHSMQPNACCANGSKMFECGEPQRIVLPGDIDYNA